MFSSAASLCTEESISGVQQHSIRTKLVILPLAKFHNYSLVNNTANNYIVILNKSVKKSPRLVL